jgi:S1-C subfamily serine protease
MDALDIVLILFVILAAIHGLRLGAAVQVLSFAGGLIGLGIGIGLIVVISPHVHDQFMRTFVALLLLLVPSSVTWGIGRQVGAKLWKRMRGRRFAAVDSATGVVIAMAGTLVIVWLLASVLADSQYHLISSEIQQSRVVRAVTQVMPPLPNELATVERLLDENGFPLPYIGVIQPVGPVALPVSSAVRQAVDNAGRSTVQIIAEGCAGVVIEGSGFVVAPGLVVTNAHVIAGTDNITEYDGVQSERATPVFFDPNYDLAVLRVPDLSVPPLRIDPNYVLRGTKAVVLGYPNGGAFNAQPAGVLMRFDPESTNIYGTASTQREIYELQALVRPGNSGGPLVEPNGLVVGVVFSRDANNSEIGFALSSPGVLQRVHEAQSVPAGSRVSTGGCISG